MPAHLRSIATMSGRHYSILIFQMRNLRLLESSVPLESHIAELGFPLSFQTPNLQPFPEAWAALAS